MTTAEAATTVETLSIDVVSDVVCPWCYIGKRKLEAALGMLSQREPGLAVKVRWHPFQLNPELPVDGVPRASYLEAKFGGGKRAAEIYARVTAVGAEVGIPFDFDRIDRQPNTQDAHRLIAWAQQRGDADALVERLFRAYFIDGRFVGDRDELVRIGVEEGYPAEEIRVALTSDAGLASMQAEDREARDAGISGVPFFIFNGRTAVSGAHNPETLLDAMTAARKDS